MHETPIIVYRVPTRIMVAEFVHRTWPLAAFLFMTPADRRPSLWAAGPCNGVGAIVPGREENRAIGRT